MATYTSNYAWTKPGGNDPVDISVLNGNLDSQDAIMHKAFTNMAQAFSQLSTYAVGDIVLYDNDLYKCHTAVVTPGSWTGSTNWTSWTLAEGGGGGGTSDYPDLTNKPQVNGVTLTGNKTTSDLGINADTIPYDNTDSGLSATDVQGAVDELAEEKTDKSDIAPEFSTTTAYAKGDLVYYNGTLYEFNQAHAAGAWNASHADAKDVDGAIADAVNAISSYTAIKTVTADGVKTWKTLINELFNEVNLYISSDIILIIAQSRFSLNYNASTSKRFTCIYSGLNVLCINYNPSNTANTAYTSYSITTNGVTAAHNTDVVPASGEKLRLYARSR